jgi:hypothetical protein
MDERKKFLKMKSFSALAALEVVMTLLAATSCSSNQNTKVEKNSVSEQGTANRGSATTRANSDPGIDLNCVYDRIQNPPDSFHYVFKKDTSDNVHIDQEADVSPQSVDGFRRRPDGTQQPLHGVRSDEQSWQGALAGLTGISGMSSAIALIRNGSAIKREPDGGQVNGYQAIHYSIDTARFDAAEQKILGATMGPGGFEKGDAWVASSGCPVKLVLDDEMHKNDGTLLEKVHYEEAMVKK